MGAGVAVGSGVSVGVTVGVVAGVVPGCGLVSTGTSFTETGLNAW